MNILKTAIIATALVSTIASAAPCDNFQIRLKNERTETLAVKISLTGADVQPGTFEKLNGSSEQVFTVNRTGENGPMDGVFTLTNSSLKTLRIKYNLNNSGLVCEHTDYSPQGDFGLEKTRKVGEVQYTIK